ncbi:MAG TPA: PBP1A family penicillin-binding protein [Candidatus Paceibacterota bacterium]|nr:PBP1A family penicillin-binding protein [Candidatus Paceibacterota bacterium]
MRKTLRFGLLAGIMCAGVFTAWAVFATVPSIETIENRSVAESTKIYDRTGNVLLYDVHGAVRRTEVPFEEISPYIRNATVAIEDDTFYQHNGFRPLSFLRAVLVNLHILSGYRGQGGSTITQQVIKNTLLTQDKTLIRKAKEIVLAMKLERIASKDEILNIYLNETSYGGTIYGVEEAAQNFFGKAAKDVSLAEAAYIAALPQAPTRYSPYGNNREELEARKNHVLAKMFDLGYITEGEYTAASQEQVQFRPREEAGIKAPHFVFFVREYLEEKYGADTVANEGLRVITTLDWDLQLEAEHIVRERALANEKQFNAENAGLVAIDPKTGQILTMVGSRGFLDPDIDGQVNVTIMPRQPGSAFKPFVYATAFEKGYTTETVLFDVQTQFSTACAPHETTRKEDPCYSPDNYDHAFRGPVTIRNALAQSINVPAVKALYLAGIDDSISTAADMGISTLEGADRYGLTLVLGGGEVTLLEMTSAYGVFANEGVRNPPTGILRVEDSHGRVLEEYEQSESRALDPQIARLITDILSDNVARTPLYGSNSPLYFPDHDVAAKTGTTNDNRDAWVLGYSTSIVAGAWAGNNIPEPMNQISGLIVTPMWREFMDVALEKYPGTDFTPPAPDPEWDSLPSVLRGQWNSNPSLGIHSILYWIDKDNPRSGRGGNHNDSQFAYWEYGVSLWTGSVPFGPTTPGSTPQLGFAIAAPTANAQLPLETFDTFVEYETALGVTSVTYYLDGEFVGVSNQPPFMIAIQPERSGQMTLRAVAETATGQEAQSEISITIE